MKKLFFLFFLSSFSCSVFSATYYVSSSGNNGSNGLSVPAAWLTLQHAANAVAPGDSVVVLAGTYVGFYQTTSGMANARIIFSAEPGVLIDAPNNTTDDGINLEGASYITIEGFKVYGVPRTGIRTVDNTNVIIRNNICDSCGVWGILTGFSENIIIENNTCTRSVDQHGIYFGNSADNPIIRNNVCWGNSDCGIHMNGDASLGGDGIISNALVENNILFDNGYSGGSAINCDGVQNSVIQNNLIYNNHASGISLYRIDGGDGSKNNVIVNNTILQPADGRWALNISDGSTGNKAFNNIFYSDHAFRGSISIDAASMTGFHSNYNIQTNRQSTDGGNTNMTLAQWQQTTHLDSNSVIASPASLFANVATDDYHLISSAPAVDLGRTSYYSASAPSADLENVVRPQGSYPDAGCYEFSSGTIIHEVFVPSLNEFQLPGDAVVFWFDYSGRLVHEGKISSMQEAQHVLDNGLFFFIAYSKNATLVAKGELMVVH